ncbi:NfeD family protein [Soonwooa sp.]|uniref:NfeD family protein n=1 Tax=Soonwooa sp. TaxID=1938592 RepID=UPI00289840C9|nr:NfeD family protein [Soonwooa sp.]
MLDFLQGMDSLQQAFWWIAIAASLIFLVQTILTLIGSDASDGINADFDGNLDHADAPFQLFSFRNLVNFLLGFGWAGVAFYQTIANKTFLVIVAALVGLVFIALYFVIIKQILKLSEDNTFDISKLIGKSGEVYLTIPSEKSGQGKVLISLNGTNHELTAVSETEAIQSGKLVKVVRIEDKILIVEKI